MAAPSSHQVVTVRADEALSYAREFLVTAGRLSQEVPVAGEVCGTFLEFEQLVVTAKHNKENLAVLSELSDVVIESVLRDRCSEHWSGIEQVLRRLKKHMEGAREVARACNGRVKQFLLYRKILRDIAAARKNLLDFSRTINVELTDDLHEKLDVMVARLADQGIDQAPIPSSCRGSDDVNFSRRLTYEKLETDNTAGNEGEVDEGAFKTSPCPIPCSDDEDEFDELMSEVFNMSLLDGPLLSRGLDGNMPSQEMTPNALESTLTASLGPGPVTYVSEAHAVEFELQDGSLDEELPVKMTITQGLAFVDCRTEGTARAPSYDIESTEECLAMTFVHGPEGVTFPDDKPAKLRVFLGYVDDLAPASESGSDQVVITDEEIERDILEAYRPLSSPDGVENWTTLGKYSVVFRRRLGQREVWVETPVYHFSVIANAMKVDKGGEHQSYFYGDLGGLRWWFKGRSKAHKVRFGNTTKDECATFTYYPIVQHTEASSESEFHAEIGAIEGTLGGGKRSYSSATGAALPAAGEKITTLVAAGTYEDRDLCSDIKKHLQMHVRVGVLQDMTGRGFKSRGKLQLLDVLKISGNKILVLREPRLSLAAQFPEVDWPCNAEDICKL